jgi:glycerol-3-phosphate cytidylyltransferase
VTGPPPVVGFAPGVFDVFHVGHLNLLRRVRRLCGRLVVGVLTDEEVVLLKGRSPRVPGDERVEVVASTRCVDEAVLMPSLDRREAWERHRFDALFKGGDWQDTERGRALEREIAVLGAGMHHLPYTEAVSTTMLRTRTAAGDGAQRPG